MNVHKIISKRLRRRLGGLDVASDVNVVAAANLGEDGRTTAVSSRQRASAGTPATNVGSSPFANEKDDQPKEDR